jgi:hypothetical protein
MNLRVRSVFLRLALLFGTLAASPPAQAQVLPAKQVKEVSNFWISANNTLRFSDHWGMIADLHVRRKEFMKEPDFYFVRTGVNYWFTKNFSFNAGYGHMWVMPASSEKHTVANENRLHQQFILSTPLGRVAMLQRLRNEERWIQNVVNDQVAGVRFSDRVRYLLSFNVRVFNEGSHLPSLVLSDELMVQFGRYIVYNTFDQNRLFLGIRQDIRPDLSFDLGYMRIFQQKGLPLQYERHDVLRLFFYWSPDLRRYFRPRHPEMHHPDDE